jgi:hypothetical protein
MGRFRDAVKAYSDGFIPFPNSDLLKTVWSYYFAKIVDDEVWILPKTDTVLQAGFVPSSETFFLVVNSDSEQVIRAILILISDRIIPNASVRTSLDLIQISNSYDAAVIQEPDGSYSIC